MSVVVSLAARRDAPLAGGVARRRLPDGRGAQVVILPCIRREPLRDEVLVTRTAPAGEAESA